MTALTDATFYAPLKTTLVPTNGSGNPTFTRTSTITVEDNEGNVKTLKSGAVALAGARVVQTWVSNASEDFTHASWTKGGGVTVPSANLLVCANATIGQYLQDASVVNAVLVGQQWLFTYRVQYVDIQYVQIAAASGSFGSGQYCNFDLINGDYTATGCTAIITAVSAGVWDISALFTVTTAGAAGVNSIVLAPSQSATRIQAFVGDGIKSLGILRAQFENVTGKAIQTAGEYVSVGVLSAPYHGAGADGVKYFDTDSSGVAIPDATMLGAQLDYASKTSSMLYCRDMRQAVWKSTGDGIELSVNGSFATDTDWVKSAGAAISSDKATLTITAGGMQYVYQSGLNLLANTAYIIVLDVTEVSGAGVLTLCTGAGTNLNVGTLFDTVMSASGTYTFSVYTGGGAISNLGVKRSTGSGDYIWDINSISVQKSVVQPALTQTGVDGLANACSLLTFNATDATIFQTISAASAPGCTGWKVKRATGTDPVYITRDGGATYTDISDLINSSTFTLVGIENTSVLNPVVGFKGSTGNELIVDSGRNHSGTELCEDIFTTTAAVTRNAEVLTYQTAGNIRDSQGTIIAKVQRDNWENGNGGVVGSATRGLHTSATNKGVNALDGTNTVTGNAGTPTGQRFMGFRWSGAAMKAFAVESFGTEGSYDGALNLSTIAVMPGTQGYIRDLAIYQTALTDVEILQVIGTQRMTNRSDDHDHITSQAPFQYWDDGVSSASYIYCCSAPAGTETSAAGWRIARYEIATGKTMYADGDTKFDNIADDRTSLTYSFT